MKLDLERAVSACGELMTEWCQLPPMPGERFPETGRAVSGAADPPD
ncbi:hypothetical protein GCM10009789_50400 [Kribbella sancticallisti]|uniref:Uncharacterized protein n=1 Tax=Kribbella sancticallisti TaxID=460087 RepID=A0ABN2DZE1_9ACTN